MESNKGAWILLGLIFFGCMLAFVFVVKFPIGCDPGPLKFIATFFGKCDY